MKRIISIILSCVLLASLLLFSGCGLFKESPKTFTKGGMSITLTNRYKEAKLEGQTVAYDSKKIAVFALKEEFTLFEGTKYGKDSSLEDYANLVITANDVTASVNTENGLTSFTYTGENGKQKFTYFATVFKSEDAFWLIQFATESANYEAQKDTILSFAKSISFS